jgi:Ring finger domain
MEDLICSVCQEDIREGNEVGEINNCNHRFCIDCISKWATIENRCPCCKVRFDVIRRKQVSCTPGRLKNLPANAPIPGKILGEERCEEVNQRPIFEDPSFEQWIANVVCLVCGNADNEDQLLLCDGKLE